MTQLSLLVKSCQGHRYNQTDPPPPALLRDGEDLLNIAPNNAGVEGGFCRVGAEGPPGLRGARGRQGTPLWGNCVCEQAPSSVM